MGTTTTTALPLVLRTPRGARPSELPRSSRPDATVQTVVATAGRPQTVVDVLHKRALRQHAEALRQHLAHRLGDMARAERAFEELRAILATAPTSELVAAPGVRAQFFRRARLHAAAVLAREGYTGDPSALPYRVAPSEEVSAVLLSAIRCELLPHRRELLELRVLRGLELNEIAFIVGEPEGAVLDELDATYADLGRLRARHHEAAARALPQLVDDALSLCPAPAIQEEEWEPLSYGTVVGGRYATERRVGGGAFGDVYLAKDTDVPGHIVALKILHQASFDDDARTAALRELRLIASVFHPSVVQFKDHGWHEGRLWFVMPWYEGETLEARITRAPLSRPEAQRIFQPLARALAAMHAAGIRHQDVKPDNILLARLPGGGEDEVLPVLLDLGVAATEAERVVAGTPTYFAPEVAALFTGRGDNEATSLKADVFSLALTLRNALEPDSREEVEGGAIEAFIAKRADKSPGPPKARELRFLRSSLQRWMHLDPSARPSAEELAHELEVLTLPEQRRTRRKAVFAIVAPIVALFALIIVVSVAVLEGRARHQALEATRARTAAAALREDLDASEVRAGMLEARVRSVAAGYERSRASLEDIAADLVTARDALGQVRQNAAEADRARVAEIATLTQRADATRRDAEQLRTERDAERSALARSTEALRDSERLANERGQRLAETNQRLSQAEDNLADQRDQLTMLNARLEGERARAARLEAALTARPTRQAPAPSEAAPAPSEAPGAPEAPPALPEAP